MARKPVRNNPSSSSAFCLTVELRDKQLAQNLVFTGVYGPTSPAMRSDFFRELEDHKPNTNSPWIVCGDFNLTLHHGERNSQTTDWRWPLQFAHVLADLGLQDMQLRGRKFTWSNSRYRPSMAKLDRFFISADWAMWLPNSTQRTLPNSSSDHCPVVYTAATNFSRSKIFRFENYLLRLDDFKLFVETKWLGRPVAQNPIQLQNKIFLIQKDIQNWVKHNVGKVKQQMKICRDFMAWVDESQERRLLTDLEKRVKALIKKRYSDLSVLEEDIWRQRAKLRWEIHGDKSTKFFHAYASAKKARNMIGGIEQRGRLHTNQRDKARIFREFYMDLMGKQEQVQTVANWSELYPIRKDLDDLSNDITEEEIKMVITSWPNNKAPGPDGLTGEFYKAFMHALLPDLKKVIHTVTTQPVSLAPLNSSYITLLPKTENPTKPQDFRPISLIHSVQKIVSKVLANRLQGKIGQLVHESQTGFIKGRHITEGFVYAQEMLHYSRKNKIPLAIFKADIHKAFDTLGWEFLARVMRELGFNQKWITWIINLVLNGSSQILIDGLLGKKINLQRGVRQGDPLSPFLFIMAMDFVPRWIVKLTSSGALRMPISNMNPCLLYADDALFFVKPTMQ